MQCYQCSREDNNDAEEHCALSSSSVLGNNTKINCSAGEDHCLIMKRFTKEKSVDLFIRRCADKSECHKSCTDPDEKGVKICDQCCEEDLCNKGMGPPLPLSRTSRIQMMTGPSLPGWVITALVLLNGFFIGDPSFQDLLSTLILVCFGSFCYILYFSFLFFSQ